MKLWVAGAGWVTVIVRAETAEEAERIAAAKAEEVGCEEMPDKAWELTADGDPGIAVEVIS
jgi:hypothetical protein